ncbi:helix-turn-helix domain-containing protein [Actinomadura rudentiformis]|uniref:helix-turn-helix domain-containing protein n=1 Tax=Actinomadura rudentiformis TaxID=359158 RepID=UPI001CEF7424|nr:helix-turn-helix transcriptional regulator [Actinomadura rudentiformis]
MTFGEKLRVLMDERGIGVRELARMVPCDHGHLSKIRAGDKVPSPKFAERLDELLDADGTLAELKPVPIRAVTHDALGETMETIELARRVAATDVGDETLVALEMTVDDLASAYPSSAPDELLARTRQHLAYVSQLMDARMTLAERRRLVVVGGWLSLLAATCDVDLGRRPAATARLRTAAQLARHVGHPEILAWTLETQAWQHITDGDYRQAVKLSRGAQEVAPKNGSAFIQATAQEGRVGAARGRWGDWCGRRNPRGPGARRAARGALADARPARAPLPV